MIHGAPIQNLEMLLKPRGIPPVGRDGCLGIHTVVDTARGQESGDADDGDDGGGLWKRRMG